MIRSGNVKRIICNVSAVDSKSSMLKVESILKLFIHEDVIGEGTRTYLRLD